MAHPSFYHPDLIQERLVFVAHKIQEQVDLTYDTNNHEHDGPQSQGSVIFCRVLSVLTQQSKHLEPNWLNPVKLGNGLVFKIGNIPCRFATDNPEAPKKNHILQQGPQELSLCEQQSFQFEEDDEWMIQGSHPIKWRWVIQKAYSDMEVASVHFLGLNQFDSIVCRWDYRGQVPSIYMVDGSTPSPKASSPATVKIPAATVRLKAIDGGKIDESQASANNKNDDRKDE